MEEEECAQFDYYVESTCGEGGVHEGEEKGEGRAEEYAGMIHIDMRCVDMRYMDMRYKQICDTYRYAIHRYVM